MKECLLCRVITHPLQPRLSTKSKIIGIAIVWIFAIGITIPYTISQGLHEEGVLSICIDQGVLSELGRNIYVTSWIVTGWGVPFIIISFLYTLCILDLRKISTTNSNDIAVNQRKTENQKVVKMFIIIVCLFFILTTPYSLMYVTFNYLLTYRRSELDVNLIMKLNYALFVITTSNSCMNPLIYAKLHQEINPFVKKVAKRICCKFTGVRKRGNSYGMSAAESSSRKNATKSTDASRVATYSNQAYEGAQ